MTDEAQTGGEGSPPAVSVLMPVFDAERYVSEAVESILNQTFSDFEFIIINDGSTDKSLRILERYAARDERIRLISRANKGLIASLNEGIALAKAPLVARMDADDIALPDRLSRQVSFLDEHPEIVCLGGDHWFMDSKGRLLTLAHPATGNEEIQSLLLVGHNHLCHPTVVMRREAVERAGGYDPDTVCVEDYDLWLRLGEIGSLANLDSPVLHYRLLSSSISSARAEEQLQNMRGACERAWKRRNIEGTFEVKKHWRPGDDRKSRFDFNVKYGWWAFNSGYRRTALLYGMKALSVLPFKLEGWRLLVCSLIKAPRGREGTL